MSFVVNLSLSMLAELGRVRLVWVDGEESQLIGQRSSRYSNAASTRGTLNGTRSIAARDFSSADFLEEKSVRITHASPRYSCTIIEHYLFSRCYVPNLCARRGQREGARGQSRRINRQSRDINIRKHTI